MRLDKVSCDISILPAGILAFPVFLAGPQPQIPVSAKIQVGARRLGQAFGATPRLAPLPCATLRGRLPLSLPEASVPGFW
jgi:hypothetical protein